MWYHGTKSRQAVLFVKSRFKVRRAEFYQCCQYTNQNKNTALVYPWNNLNIFANFLTGKVSNLQHWKLVATIDFYALYWKSPGQAGMSIVIGPKGNSQTSSSFGDFGNCLLYKMPMHTASFQVLTPAVFLPRHSPVWPGQLLLRHSKSTEQQTFPFCTDKQAEQVTGSKGLVACTDRCIPDTPTT